MYTVKQLADLAGISRRTLHYYDEKGLLKPTSLGDNGYRYYGDEALLQLQQILFYRELGLELRQIKKILEDPDFDTATALQAHRRSLREKIKRLQTLIRTVDTTIMHLIGEVNVSEKNIFEGFSEEKQKEYEDEAVARWGDEAAESIQLWNSYSAERKAEIMQEGAISIKKLLVIWTRVRMHRKFERCWSAGMNIYATFMSRRLRCWGAWAICTTTTRIFMRTSPRFILICLPSSNRQSQSMSMSWRRNGWSASWIPLRISQGQRQARTPKG